MTAAASSHDHLYILFNLVAKDFKVRYRNMSLGILWSLVNPIVMMVVLTFVFTILFEQQRKNFPLFLLLGLLPYNFFSLGWSTGTSSVIDNASLIKRVPFWRELLPVSVVLGNALHYVIQMMLLLVAVLWFTGFNLQWAWIPVLIALQLVFVCGLSLITASLDVYYRDVRYVVESANLVLFWLCPIFYGMVDVDPSLRWVYELNPVSAVIYVMRRICLQALPPPMTTFAKMVVVSFATFAFGAYTFRRLKKDFADYL